MKELLSSEQVFVSVIQIAEVADWSVRNNLPAVEEITAVKEFAQIVPLDEKICEDSARIKKKRRSGGHKDFGLVDALILATARSVNQRLLTIDQHFAGEEDCMVLKSRVIREKR